MTLLVGPRLVARAVSMRITVSNPTEYYLVRGRSTTYQQVIVNQSKDFKSLKYIVTEGKSLFFRENDILYDAVTWDPHTSVLTIENRYFRFFFINFTFRSESENGQDGGLSVLISYDNAIVRIGSSPSLEEQRIYHENLESQSQDTDEEENLVLTTGDGRQWILLVTLSDVRQVQHWDIRHVNVDAIDVTGLPTTDYPAERRKRRSEIDRRHWPTYSESSVDSQSSEEDIE